MSDTPMDQPLTYASEKAWHEEGVRRFGPDVSQWRFICPSCGHIASVQDWNDLGGNTDKKCLVAFSCIGRLLPKCEQAFQMGKGPCNYAGGGLFAINPIHIDGRAGNVFAFAPVQKDTNEEKHDDTPVHAV